jgi:hypothetical protein
LVLAGQVQAKQVVVILFLVASLLLVVAEAVQHQQTMV